MCPRKWHLSFFSWRTRLKGVLGYCARDSMRFLVGRRGNAGAICQVDTDVKAVCDLGLVFKPGLGAGIRYRTANTVAVFWGSAWVLNTRQVFMSF